MNKKKKEKMSCDLCKAFLGEKDLGKYYVLICNTCHVPMIVLKEHRASITKEEQTQQSKTS
jgi:hypothetical protein